MPHNLAEEPQIPRQGHPREGNEHPFQLADSQCLDERGLFFEGLPFRLPHGVGTDQLFPDVGSGAGGRRRAEIRYDVRIRQVAGRGR